MMIINVQGLHFQYGKEPVINDVSFKVDRGEFICLAGVNGSGKSTLLKLLLKLLTPSAGRAEILTDSVAYLAQRASAFNPDFPVTAAEVVGLGNTRGSFKERRQSIDRALERMDMLKHRNKPIGCLSGGQQQRVLLAKALVQEPDLILLDEPTVGIDNNAAGLICKLLRELNKREGATLMMATHDSSLILEHADRVLQFDKGKVLCL